MASKTGITGPPGTPKYVVTPAASRTLTMRAVAVSCSGSGRLERSGMDRILELGPYDGRLESWGGSMERDDSRMGSTPHEFCGHHGMPRIRSGVAIPSVP